MKKQWIFATALMTAVLLAGCSEKPLEGVGSKASKETEEVATKEVEVNKPSVKDDSTMQANASTQVTTKQTVVVDDAKYKVTLLEISNKNEEFRGELTEVKFEIENKTSASVDVYANMLSVDGYMVDDEVYYLYSEIAPNKKAKASLVIQNLDGYDYPEFKENLEMVLNIDDASNWDLRAAYELSVSFK